MRISLNEVLPSVPWNLVIEIDGTEFKIRPWTLADTQQMRLLGPERQEELYAFVEGLFEGEQKPAVREWDEDRAIAFMGTVQGYKAAISQKKAQAVAAIVQKMATKT